MTFRGNRAKAAYRRARGDYGVVASGKLRKILIEAANDSFCAHPEINEERVAAFVVSAWCQFWTANAWEVPGVGAAEMWHRLHRVPKIAARKHQRGELTRTDYLLVMVAVSDAVDAFHSRAQSSLDFAHIALVVEAD
ncbi:MAG: hypothetical protein ACE5K1_03260 [Acidiferrobacterales bacterium]